MTTKEEKQKLKEEAWEAYKKAIAPTLEAYAKAQAPAWEAYMKVQAPAYKAYEKRIKEIEAMK